MRNGAIAEVVTDRARGVLPTSAEAVSLAGDVDESVPTRVPPTDVVTEMVVELGETNLWVTVERSGTFSRPELVKGALPGQFPADLRVTEAGRWFWGAQRLRADDILVSNILSRTDDPVPMLVAGQVIGGAEMVARQVATLFSLVKPLAPSRLTLVHPVDLSRRGRTAVESHLRRRLPADTSVRWISRAEAVMAAVPECTDVAAGDRVGILHVGGSCVEAAVWRQSSPSAGDVVAVRVDRGNAGHAVDDALLAALCHGTGLGRSEGRTPDDLPRLRRACERAKVALSTETAVDVDVNGMPVRMVRSDVEQLSARLLTRQLDILGTALSRSEEDGAPLRMILLVGGAASAPSLVEAASSRFDVPVIAVPRVGDRMARFTAERSRVALGAAPAAASPGRGEVPAPTSTGQASTGAALARARRHWDPLVSLTAVPATASEPPRDRGDQPAEASGAENAVPPSFSRAPAGPRRIPFRRPTHLAMAAAVLMGVAAVPAIGGAMKSADDTTTSAARNGLGSAAAAAPGGLLGGSGLVFTPGAGGPAGPSGTEWLANPTGTLGPSQLLSMAKPAASGDSPSSGALTAAGASTVGGAKPANGSIPASSSGSGGAPSPAGRSTPAAGSTPAGSTPVGGSSPASSGQPAATSPASNPAPASDPPSTTNPPQSSDAPPPSDPAPSGGSSGSSTPEPSPSSADSAPAPDPAPAPSSTGGSGGGSADVAASADATAAP